MSGQEPTWDLRCPVCHVRPVVAPDALLVAVARRLAFHLVELHPYELRMLELMVQAEDRRRLEDAA